MRICKILSILLIVLLLLTATACSTNGYRLIKENGSYSVELSEEILASFDSNYLVPHELQPIVFSSIDEMVNDIRNGSFTDTELQLIARCPQDSEGRHIITNLDTLLVPILPNICDKYEVHWYGTYYFIAIYFKNGDRGGFREISQELLYKNYNFHDPNYRSFYGDILSDETENNIRTLKRQDGSVIYTMRIYTITENNVTYDFCEYYKTNDSETILDGFDVVIHKNDSIYLLSCNTITEPLSLEIVKQFDLIPCTE